MPSIYMLACIYTHALNIHTYIHAHVQTYMQVDVLVPSSNQRACIYIHTNLYIHTHTILYMPGDFYTHNSTSLGAARRRAHTYV